MKSLKIGIFTDSFYPSVGGTETVVQKLASQLAKTNEVTVFCPASKKADDQNFNFKIVRAKATALSENDLYALPGLDSKFKKKLQDSDLDIIHCHTVSKMAGVGIKLAKKRNIPCVATIHTKFKTCYKSVSHSNLIANIMTKNLVRLINKASLVTTVSHNMKEELEGYGYKKEIKIINNGIDIEKIINTQKNKQALTKPLLIYVGRIEKYKNLDFSLKALKILKEQEMPFEFWLVGRGSKEKHYQKLINKLGLQDRCFLKGLMKQDELRKLFKQATLQLFPSTFDSDGLSVSEAMAYGTPSLVLKNTGASEKIIDGENGFTAENDINAYAKRISEILSNENLLNNIKNHKLKTWEEIANEYLNLYHNLLSNKLSTID
ncbi:MAG: glycosyltransferase [Bacilli bacterium]|jgi:glycosyltransferase involved in cell wall biosynthesis